MKYKVRNEDHWRGIVFSSPLNNFIFFYTQGKDGRDGRDGINAGNGMKVALDVKQDKSFAINKIDDKLFLGSKINKPEHQTKG